MCKKVQKNDHAMDTFVFIFIPLSKYFLGTDLIGFSFTCQRIDTKNVIFCSGVDKHVYM